MGKSGSVSFGVTAPFSWVLECARFCLCPARVCFPVLCKFWWLHGGLMVTSPRGFMLYPDQLHPEPLPLQQSTTDLYLHRRHSNTVLSLSLGPGAQKFCLSPLSVFGGNEFDSKHDFTPPTILLGLLLCPWMWGILFWWNPTFSCQRLFSSEL